MPFPARRHLSPPLPRLHAWLVLAALCAVARPGVAQIEYRGTGYVQDFDTLQGAFNNTLDLPWSDNSTLPGWYADRRSYTITNGTLGGSAGTFDDTAIAGNAGLFSFGTAAANERALGLRAAGDAPLRVGVRLINRTGQTLTRFAIAYVGEQWFRSSASAAQSLTVEYQVGATNLTAGNWTAVPALAFTSPSVLAATPATLNGNTSTYRSTRVAMVSDVAWAPNQELWIRFTDADDPGAEHGLAVDDFAFWTGEDSALFFNGMNNYVSMGVAPAFGLRTFTLECWFLRTGAGATSGSGSGGVTGVPLITKGRGESDGSNVDCNFFFGLDSSGRLIADFESMPAAGIAAGQNFPITGNATAAPGLWHHAAVTFDGASWCLYLDGTLDAAMTLPAGAMPRFDSIQHFGLGTALNSTGVAEGYFQGVIDEVRVWSTARSPAEIRATRDLPIEIPPPELIARYALNEGSGTTIRGQVAGAPIGALTRSPAWVLGRRLAPNLPPTAVLTSPPFDYTGMAPATVPLVAEVDDLDGVVVKVEYFANAVKIAESATPPFAAEWHKVPAGNHVLTAVAIDNLGDRGTSAALAIIVDPNPDRPPDVALAAPADFASISATATDLRVALDDPERAALRVTFYGRKTVPPSPGDDFVLGTLPDTQYYTQNLSNRATAFYGQTRWYVDQRDTLNLAFVSHMGDISNSGDVNPDTLESNLPEWIVADTALKTLEDRALTLRTHGIPWGVAPGNHDQTPNGSATGTSNFFNQFFGVSRFTGRPYYGGNYGTNNDNNYQFFSASGLEFIIVHLEYDARDPESYRAVLDWADALLAAHPHRRAIVTSHWMVNTGYPATFSTQGRAIYERLKHRPNLFLLLGGHIHGEGRRSDVFAGRTVHSVLQDYQNRANGGDGWLRYYVFSPDRNTITARTYSPKLNQWETDTDSEFTLVYNMQSSVMDWVPLGSVNVPPGATTATLAWTGLERGAHYEWYAEADDGINTAAAAAQSFSTVPTTPPVVALTAPVANSRVGMPATVRLAATVNGGNGDIARVEFYEGNTKISEDTTAPYEATWSGPISGHYSLSAAAVDRQGAYTLSPIVSVIIFNPQNQPPTARLTGPAGGTRYVAPAAIALAAETGDTDGVVVRVEFFADVTKLGERTQAPFNLVWSSVGAGNYTLTARVTDNDGGVTTSAPIAVTVLQPVVTELIPRNAVWKYRDDGSNQGTAWRASAFDDSGWAAGPAELGYGDGDEATVIGFGSNPASRAVTAYFRRKFTVTDPARINQLALNLVRDDGALVYLNGVEIGRSNLNAGTTYLYTTLAPTAVEGVNEITFFPLTFTVDPRPLLVRGENTLAVEVHQRVVTNSDLSFNLELLDRQFPVGLPPTVALTAPAAGAGFVAPASLDLAATATDPDGTVAKVEFFQGREKIGEAARAPFTATWANVPAGSYTLSAVATDNTGNAIRSAPVAVVVREANPGRFVNFSLRSNVGAGTGTLIVGFATGGTGTQGSKPLLLRAVGPALANFGIANFLADPAIQLYRGSTLVASNDDWDGDPQATAVAAQVGAFPLGDPESRDAALVRANPAGAYSLQIAGAGGIALAEIYDATPVADYTPATPRLVNLSVRALVGPTNNPLIAGFVLGGSTERRVLLRAVGPALSSFGVTGFLADPTLEIFRAGQSAPIATNLNWGGTAVLATAFAQAGAFNLGATSRDAALLVRLAPGVYTAQLSAAATASGVALIEIYELP